MSGTQKIQHLMEFSQADQQHGFALKLMELLVIPTFVIDIHGKVIIYPQADAPDLVPVESWGAEEEARFVGESGS